MRGYLIASCLVLFVSATVGCAESDNDSSPSTSIDSDDATDGSTGLGFADTQSTGSDGLDSSDSTTSSDATDSAAAVDTTDGMSDTDSASATDETTATDTVDGVDGESATDEATGTSASDTANATDATDGTDAADTTTGTDTTDMTTGADAVDTTTGSDATDGTDGTVATDGSTGTDSTDGTDGTTGCQPFCGPGWECGSDGCGGACAPGCGPGTVCNYALHICEPDAQPVAQFGEYCGISGTCVPTLNTGEDNPEWPACANDQCESGFCLFGLNGQQSVCSKPCTLTSDITDGEGNPFPDGIDDAANNGLDCSGAVDGPYGTDFTCVQWLNPSQGQFLNLCQPGTTFADCKADNECPAGEVCTILYVNSDYVTKCQTARESAGVGGAACNFDPYDGEVAYCQNDICRAGYCLSFCNDNADCNQFQNCIQDAQLYNNVEKTFDFCQGAACFSNADCPEGSGCDLYWNGQSGENAGWDPLCAPKPAGASFTGGTCDGDPDDGISGPECVGPCLASGTCSSFCLADDDCDNPTQGMVCAIQEQDFDLEPEAAPDGVPEFFLAYGLCLPAPGSQTPCFSDADCGIGSGEICTFHEYINVATGLLDGKGVCTTADPTEGLPGTLCGGTTGLGCQTGFCLSTFTDGSGVCSTVCEDADSCPKNIVVQGLMLDMACGTFNFADALTPNDPTDNVYVPLCQPFLDDPGDFSPCGADFSCAAPGATCVARPVVFGSTKPGYVDYRCVDTTNDQPTGTLGATCDIDTSPESPAGNGVECQSAYCLPDVTGNDDGYCTTLCTNDTDCAGIPGAVCDQLVLVPRTVGNVGPNVCQRAVSCIPCEPATGCAGDYVCANVGAAGALADMRCVPACETDAECAQSDGGSQCISTLDSSGSPTSTTGCTLTTCN